METSLRLAFPINDFRTADACVSVVVSAFTSDTGPPFYDYEYGMREPYAASGGPVFVYVRGF